MKKRMISLMLLSAMMTGMLAGCGETKVDDADVSSKAEESSSEKSEEQPEDSEPEITTVKILARASAAVEQAGGFNWDAPAP